MYQQLSTRNEAFSVHVYVKVMCTVGVDVEITLRCQALTQRYIYYKTHKEQYGFY